MSVENGLFSTAEFKGFSKNHVMFLSIMTRIGGRADDDLLGTYGFRGFPSFGALDSKGKMLVKPRGRSIDAFEAAMKEAKGLDPNSKKAAARQLDTAKIAKDFLRRLKRGGLRRPATERAIYVSCREALDDQQRAAAETAITMHELEFAQKIATRATLGSISSDRAMLDMLAVKTKLGGWPMTKEFNSPLVSLMRWAEHRKDPQLFAALFGDFSTMRAKAFADDSNNEKLISDWKARLEGCWNGEPAPKSSGRRGR